MFLNIVLCQVLFFAVAEKCYLLSRLVYIPHGNCQWQSFRCLRIHCWSYIYFAFIYSICTIDEIVPLLTARSSNHTREKCTLWLIWYHTFAFPRFSILCLRFMLAPFLFGSNSTVVCGFNYGHTTMACQGNRVQWSMMLMDKVVNARCQFGSFGCFVLALCLLCKGPKANDSFESNPIQISNEPKLVLLTWFITMICSWCSRSL